MSSCYRAELMTVYTLKYDTFSVQCHNTVFHFKTAESDFLRNHFLKVPFSSKTSMSRSYNCGSSALQSIGSSTVQVKCILSEISSSIFACFSFSPISLFAKLYFVIGLSIFGQSNFYCPFPQVLVLSSKPHFP